MPVTSTDTFTRPGDTLALPNNLGPTSNFQMQVNLGGAMGDLSWVDSKTVPIISFHAPYDRFAPYSDGVLFVGTQTAPQPVIRVQGADSVVRKMNRLGRNNVFKGLTAAYDPYKSIFDARTGGVNITGLYPILGDTVTDSSPWDFWGPNTPRSADGLATAPRSTPARAKRYIDTIMQVGFATCLFSIELAV